MAEEEDDDPLEPLTAIRVARRALALASLTCRVDLENDPDAEDFHGHVLKWLESSTIRDELEPAEARIIAAPLRSLAPSDLVNASWRSEGLAVLAWALGQTDFPAHDAQARAAQLAMPMGFLEPSPLILRQPKLRSPDALSACASRMFAIHWRLRQYSLDQRPMDFAAFAQTAWFGPLDVSGLPFVENDLAVHGVALSKAADWKIILSIAMERHQAANWLVGRDAVYSAVGTDT